MKNKLLKLFPILLGGFLLTSCGARMPLSYTKEDQEIDTPYEDYAVPLSSFNLIGGNQISVQKGKTHQIKYSYTPTTATLSTLKWTSDATNTATVNEDGEIQAIEGGQAHVTISSKVKVLWNPVILTVDVTVPLTDFTLDTSSLDLDYNGTYTLIPTFEPTNATNKELNFVSKDESIVTVSSSGIVTAKAKTGTTTIEVTSIDLPSLTRIVEVSVRDKTIHVDSVTASIETDKIEITDNSKRLLATVSPTDAKEANNIHYFVTDATKDVALIDEKTGLITPLKVGKATFYAKAEEVKSNEVTVEIFENVPSKIVYVGLEPKQINLTNNVGETSFTVVTAYLDAEGNIMTPTYSEPVFTSNDTNIATVDEKGKISAVGKGTTTIVVSDNHYPNCMSDSLNVNVTIFAKSLAINGPSNMQKGDVPITLTAVTEPTKEKISDYNIQWSIIGGEDKATLVDKLDGTATLDALKAGTVTVQAVCGDVLAIKDVVITPAPFEQDKVYIVGDHDYSTGTSTITTDEGSWNDPDRAFKMTETTGKEGAVYEYKATVIFNKGDIWKARMGDNWKNETEWVGEGETWYQVGKYNQEGATAFATGLMEFSHDENNNIIVNEAGSYDIYYGYYNNEHPEGWWQIDVVPTPTISVDPTSLTLFVDGPSSDLTISHNKGSITIDVDKPGYVKTKLKGNIVTVSAIKEGEVTLTFMDESKHQCTCNITIKTKVKLRTIYFNANYTADKDGAHLFAHAWGGNEDFDVELTKVSGQNIIYSAAIPEDNTWVTFVRQATSSTIDWNNYWNKTTDQLIPESDNMFVMTGYYRPQGDTEDYMDGYWTTYNSQTTYKNMVVTIFFNDSWAWDGDIKMFVSLFVPGGNATYILATKVDQYCRFEYDPTAGNTHFLILRCHKDTVTPNWNVKTDSAGRIYNKANAADIPLGEARYTVTFVDP